jgi:hypothetical protein
LVPQAIKENTKFRVCTIEEVPVSAVDPALG